jgi:hypothetical protein
LESQAHLKRVMANRVMLNIWKTLVLSVLLYNLINLLASEVTHGLLAGAEPDTHQFSVTIVYKGMIKWKKTQNDIVSTLKLDQACMGKWGLR